MKKWGFLVLIIILLGVGSRYLGPSAQQETKHNNDMRIVGEDTVTDTVTNTLSNPVEQTKKIDITQDQVHQGDLLLVNKEHPVRQESVKSDVVNLFGQINMVKSYALLDTNIRLSEGVAQQFQKMIEDAESEGVNHFMISSGYRDFEEQEELYQAKGSDYALPPGFSEHNLGLSLDVGSTQDEMSKAPEGRWLKENAWKYGFILRYPEDKTAITGIQYEPWHFRYVGMPHSVIMQEHNLTLEEYVDFLKENRSVSTVVDGKKYEVTYYPVSKKRTTVKIPANRKYEISGNNIDGVIITVELDGE